MQKIVLNFRNIAIKGFGLLYTSFTAAELENVVPNKHTQLIINVALNDSQKNCGCFITPQSF